MSDRYRADVARHRIGIVCISEARDAGLDHLRKTAMSCNRRGIEKVKYGFHALRLQPASTQAKKPAQLLVIGFALRRLFR
jgi:hypothetical protein